MGNTFKTMILMVIMTAILIFIGGAIGGNQGIIFAFIISMAMNMGSYWFSDKIVLKLYRAKEIKENDNPALLAMVRRLASKANLPMPKVCIIPDSSPNAFATGRNPENSAIAFTQGILGLLSEEEIEGVAAHELAHIKNRDTLISTLVASVAGAIMMIASIARWAAIFGVGSKGSNNSRGGNMLTLLATIIIAPIAATIIKLAISRSREYKADSTGAKICGNKYGLINGLKKIHGTIPTMPMKLASESTSHLMIANPFGGRGFSSLFSTHPSLEKRIENLMSF